jgi:single-strand DNA-binding protein
MTDTNSVRLIGNLGSDPDEYDGGGLPIASLSVATNFGWKNKEGSWQNETEWHRVSAFGNLAKWCLRELKKGSRVSVEGRLKTDVVEDKYGQKKYYTKIIARKIELN